MVLLSTLNFELRKDRRYLRFNFHNVSMQTFYFYFDGIYLLQFIFHCIFVFCMYFCVYVYVCLSVRLYFFMPLCLYVWMSECPYILMICTGVLLWIAVYLWLWPSPLGSPSITTCVKQLLLFWKKSVSENQILWLKIFHRTAAIESGQKSSENARSAKISLAWNDRWWGPGHLLQCFLYYNFKFVY